METIQTTNPLSFETGRTTLEEVDRLLKESKADLRRKLEKYIDFFGEFAEFEMPSKLCEKFIEFGFTFLRTNRNVSISDKKNNISLDVDIILENYSNAMLVDIKTKLTIERINDHIERLEKMRIYADLHGDSGLKSERSFLGAVAGVVVTDEERKHALEQGFYLIEPAGQSLSITPPNGKPKEW
jgi:hypothetical protein